MNKRRSHQPRIPPPQPPQPPEFVTPTYRVGTDEKLQELLALRTKELQDLRREHQIVTAKMLEMDDTHMEYVRTSLRAARSILSPPPPFFSSTCHEADEFLGAFRGAITWYRSEITRATSEVENLKKEKSQAWAAWGKEKDLRKLNEENVSLKAEVAALRLQPQMQAQFTSPIIVDERDRRITSLESEKQKLVDLLDKTITLLGKK